MSEEHSAARAELGERLRELRSSSGLSGEQLGARIARAQATISKWELGRSVPSADDAAAWARACGAPADVAAEVAELASKAGTETAAWRGQTSTGLARQQQRLGRLEAAASIIRNYQPLIVPGLLQTAEYARRVFAYAPADGPRDVGAAVKARMDRQAILFEGKNLEFVIGEAGLRMTIAPPQVMAGQLDRLASLLDLPNVEIRLLPLSAEPPVLIGHGFVVLGDPARDEDTHVSIATATDQVLIRAADKVAFYLDAFARLQHAGLAGAEARALLAAIAAALRLA